jgi:ribosomal protein S6
MLHRYINEFTGEHYGISPNYNGTYVLIQIQDDHGVQSRLKLPVNLVHDMINELTLAKDQCEYIASIITTEEI